MTRGRAGVCGAAIYRAAVVSEQRFRAMGSDVHVVIVGPPALGALARHRIEQLEQHWSRFRDDSEISRLNAAGGAPLSVSPDTRLLVERAVEAWRLTGGGFDPTLLDALRQAGYDRSFEELADRQTLATDPAWRQRFWRRPAVTDIVVAGDTVALVPEMGFDPGGIGKGLAADVVIEELLAAGAEGACVNMGGDLRVAGESPDGPGWTLSIDHPWSNRPIALVGLTDGALATSTVLRRVWSIGGRRRHHLIDPATGEPSDSDLALASVIAAEAWTAEVLAKAILLRGRRRAFDLLAGGDAALVVGHDGRVTGSDGLLAFTGGVALPKAIDFDIAEEAR